MEFINKQCKIFSDWLTENKINHNVFNKGYHIQIQVQHNFYPSTSVYYNGESGKKITFTSFKTINDLYKFLSDNTV